MAQIQDMSCRSICGAVFQLSKTKSNSGSFFINLPVDILLIIHSFLPASSQLCLLTTCHGIKRLLDHTAVSYSLLTLEQKRDYRALVIREFPNAWLTPVALRFREFEAEDLHPQPQGPPFRGQAGWNIHILRQFEQGALLIKHMHVQMSLKYDRLEKKTRQQKSFLKALLEPYHTDFSPWLEIHPLEKSGTVGHFESRPKLVSGRYLLFNQWTFTNPQKYGTIVLSELGRFGACKHQRMTEAGWGYYLLCQRRSVEYQDWLKDNFSRELVSTPEDITLLSKPFYICVDRAFEYSGFQVDGLCPHCLTEFSICTTVKTMRVRVWRDLGTEDSRWDPAWRTQLGDMDTEGLLARNDCLEIRSRYGDMGAEGQ